jgi:TetR/AcrR family transcriptional regulator
VPLPTQRRQPPTGSRKYAAILDTAEEQFGALGFKKANVDEIAARAGVSKPLIYRYFESKEQLFEAVVDRVISEWCEVVTAEGARTMPSTAHSLRGVVGASLEFAGTRAVLRGLLARESQLLLQGRSDVLDRGTRTLRRVIADVLEAGVRRGEVRTDLDLAAMADVITEVCEGFANRLMSGTAGDADPRLLDTVIEIALHGVVAKSPALPRKEGP